MFPEESKEIYSAGKVVLGRGYSFAQEFLTLAEFVTSGAYKEPGMNFFKYRKEHGE